ncbi:MAG: DUF4136 domain-containing protein [Chitinophagaceae bacterium]
MKTSIFNFLSAIAIIAVVTGCSKDPLKNLSDDDSRIYITNHDSTVNFKSYKTFSIADSVAIVDNGQSGGKDQTAFDAQFISELKSSMAAQGYTLVDKSASPDLALAVTVISNDYSGVVSYNDYGDYYGSYWDPYYWGYGGYSYYYPSYYGVYSVNETALAVDMFDLKDAATNNQIRNVWTALIRGEGIFDTNKISSQVQTLFSQSGYLKIN